MKIFEIGKSYYGRSVCDSNCMWIMKPISRSDKTIKVLVDSETKQFKIHNDIESEYINLGRHSMHPIIRAKNEYDKELGIEEELEKE